MTTRGVRDSTGMHRVAIVHCFRRCYCSRQVPLGVGRLYRWVAQGCGAPDPVAGPEYSVAGASKGSEIENFARANPFGVGQPRSSARDGVWGQVDPSEVCGHYRGSAPRVILFGRATAAMYALFLALIYDTIVRPC